MTDDVPDLDRYLERIGYRGPLAVTRSCLDALMAAHTRAIPFENLDVILGRPIDVTFPAIEAKLVGQARGGYCFEQNGLFLAVLRAVGFTATPLSARVRIQLPRQETPPRTHMFLRVDLNGEPLLVDVGVGSLSLAASMRLVLDEEQATPHETRRVVREGHRFFHQARLHDEWADVYEYTGEEMPLIDRVVANWYTSAHPQSHFRQHLMVAHALPDGWRCNLLDRELTRRHIDGRKESRMLGSTAEVVAALAEEFGLRLPPGARLPG